MAQYGSICPLDAKAEKSVLENSNVSANQHCRDHLVWTHGRSSDGRLIVSNKAVILTNFDCIISSRPKNNYEQLTLTLEK
jgi:hypothetical protein